jgi:hypothetical protein
LKDLIRLPNGQKLDVIDNTDHYISLALKKYMSIDTDQIAISKITSTSFKIQAIKGSKKYRLDDPMEIELNYITRKNIKDLPKHFDGMDGKTYKGIVDIYSDDQLIQIVATQLTKYVGKSIKVDEDFKIVFDTSKSEKRYIKIIANDDSQLISGECTLVVQKLEISESTMSKITTRILKSLPRHLASIHTDKRF